jgi:fido (protein-threonine AMPylation protein)
LLPDRVEATLAIEGISVTRRQTLDIMDAMRAREARGGAKLELWNALKATELVQDFVDRGVELSGLVIRELNEYILDDLRTDAGRFRDGPVELPGAPVPPPAASDVPPLVQELVKQFATTDECDPIVQACWLHGQFTAVHPFFDGNGRVGRLLQDYALIRHGYLPVGIPTEKREQYYTALASADQGGWDPLVELIAMLELAMITKTERIAQEPEVRAEAIRRLAAGAAETIQDKRKQKHMIWEMDVAEVISEVHRFASDLNQASTVISAQVTVSDPVTFEAREELFRQPDAHPWLYSVGFFVEARPLYKVICFLQSHKPHPSDLFLPQKDLIGMYFTGAVDQAEEPSFTTYSDAHIRLREMLFVDRNLYTYLASGPDGAWDCRDDLNVNEVVQDLFEDLFVRKAGVKIRDG